MWLDAILWWAALALLGLAVQPLVERLFSARFADRGYAFAKPVGLVAFVYLAWLLTNLGFRHSIALGGTLGALALVAALGWRARSAGPAPSSWIRDEALFLGAFAAFALVRSLAPEIFGAEKYMDFAFFNGLVRAEHFPPPDPWMARAPINYYYFGYLLFADVARVLRIDAGVAYNLSLATIGAMAASAAASIGTRLSGRRIGGALAAVALVGMGNLDGARQIFLEGRGIASFDYWRSTRVVPHTINEFPFFSVLHGDLHPHVTALVIVLALVGVALAACDGVEESPNLDAANAARVAILALLLGSLAIANPWDVPVYLTLLGLYALERLWDDERWLRALFTIAGVMAVLVASMTLLAAPFTTRFHAEFHGIGRVHERTALVPFVTVFGFLMLPAVARTARRIAAELRIDPATRDLAIAAAVFAAAVVYVATQSLVLILCIVLTATALLEILDPAEPTSRAERATAVLVATAAVAIGAAELVFLRDPYGEEFHRMNTVFKLYFQAWVLLALAFGPLVVGILDRLDGIVRRAAVLTLVAGLVASFCYPVAVVELRRRALVGSPTLDGRAYLLRDHPDDGAAIAWLGANVGGSPTVLEATGDAYSYYARVSANTGLPTVLGWANHEGIWRGSDPRITARARDVDRLYGDVGAAELGSLLARYAVRYVFFGELERERFSAASLDRFHARPEVFETVYRSGATEVLAVRQTTASD